MIYVILGMHKSGTTLTSLILHHSGINMVEDVDEGRSYDEGNKSERAAAKQLNDAILNSVDVSSIAIAEPRDLVLSEQQRTEMRRIIADGNARYNNWGFKDPRTCLTYPLWKEELGEHRIIAIYRNPTDLWRRYATLNPLKWVLKAFRFAASWTLHNRKILECLGQGTDGYLLMNFHELMTDEKEFKRLQAFVARPLEDRRKPGLYRGRSQLSPGFRIVQWLYARTGGQSIPQLRRQLDELREKQINRQHAS